MQGIGIPSDIESGISTGVQIQETLGAIYDIIDRVGQHLEHTFQTQEDKFLEEYEKQMYLAQKNLREFKKTHSQAELTKKIDEKERALRAEREKALNQTTQSSNRIKSLKTQAANLKQNLNSVEDEINFIEDQLVLSEEKNRRLNDEAKFLKLEILKHQPDFEFWEEDSRDGNVLTIKKDNYPTKSSRKASHTNGLMNSVESTGRFKQPGSKISSLKTLSNQKEFYNSVDEDFVDERELDRVTKQNKRENRNNELLKRINDDLAFQNGRFEEIFEECIRKALEKSADKNSEYSNGATVKLPWLNQSHDGTPNQDDNSQIDTHIMAEKLKLAEMKVTVQDRKVMIEEFLNNKDVREYLYKKFVEEPSAKAPPKFF